ncbi:OLC1v1018607C1 [Oldenlandia corymbosa var. corymbosa]|uniref:OLC1v1018607C1 n=1 Tax=Oldenlandia corymbosa var. corymbosa TaxID=529605 RepID=A0AAV1ECC6_OLDCO|nr:OLC1v1018607C1 [Oldenlandia corymbosa var. corymbosa]
MADNPQRVEDYMEEDGEDDVDSIVEFDGEVNDDTLDVNLDEYDMLTKVTDTSAAQARKGKDIQGIPWSRLNITRDDYRATRILQYQNYENVPASGETADKEWKPTEKGGEYYEFFYNSRVVKPTILHFQLRNLVWATSKHDVYLISNYSILHWSSMLHKLSEVLNFSGHIVPTEKHAGNLLEGFSQTQISTMAVWDRFLVAGGFQGEIICKCLDKPGVSFCTRVSYDDNAITNALEMYESISGERYFMASNNDCSIRVFNMERYELIHHYQFPWPVNVIALSSGSLSYFSGLYCFLSELGALLNKTNTIVQFFKVWMCLFPLLGKGIEFCLGFCLVC